MIQGVWPFDYVKSRPNILAHNLVEFRDKLLPSSWTMSEVIPGELCGIDMPLLCGVSLSPCHGLRGGEITKRFLEKKRFLENSTR